MSDTQTSRTYAVVVTVLLALAAAIGFFFWQKSQSYLAEKDKIQAERQSLETEKANIERDLDSLSTAYSSLRTENENLQGRVTSTAALVEQKETAIQQIKSESAKDIEALREQVTKLQRVKIEYEAFISALRTENDSLKVQNQRLTDENAQLKGTNTELEGKVEGLAKQLEEQILKTQSANFKATSFRVTTQRKTDKLTLKARRVREIDVSFDLAEVPERFQGPQKLYMVITDEKGNPIKSDNPTKATVYAPAGQVEVLAQQVKAVVLEATQRMSFHYKFDERLKSGNYVVAIYCDKGLLGASSFRLR